MESNGYLGFAYTKGGRRVKTFVIFDWGLGYLHSPEWRWAYHRLRNDKFRVKNRVPLYTIHEVPGYLEKEVATVAEVEEVEFPATNDIVQETPLPTTTDDVVEEAPAFLGSVTINGIRRSARLIHNNNMGSVFVGGRRRSARLMSAS